MNVFNSQQMGRKLGKKNDGQGSILFHHNKKREKIHAFFRTNVKVIHSSKGFLNNNEPPVNQWHMADSIQMLSLHF